MKTRIAFISEHASPLASPGSVDAGGQNVYVGELARHLAPAGYEIDIFTRRDNTSQASVLTYHTGCRVILIDAGPPQYLKKEELLPYMNTFFENMRRFMEDTGTSYQLVHANFFMSGLVAVKLKEALQIPFVITFHALGKVRQVHQGAEDKFPAERTAIEQQIIDHADKIIAECPQDKEDLLRYYDTPANKIEIVTCGVDPAQLYPVPRTTARKKLGIQDNRLVLLQLGRMVPRKGVDNVIEALSILKDRLHNPELIVVGSDDPDDKNSGETTRLMRLAEERGVAGLVRFEGRQERKMLKYYYSAADLFLTTPWYEPFGITPLESMACGTPVIGSCVGGIQYSVKDGETGYLVPPKDPEALAGKIIQAINEGNIGNMGEAAVKRVRLFFTWEQVAGRVKAIYNMILHQNAATRRDRQLIENAHNQLSALVLLTREKLLSPISAAATQLADTFRNGGKVMVCGNGGSAAESQHFTAELVGRFEIPHRTALPAISLTADPAFITAWSNDDHFKNIFSRQVEAMGQKNDVLFCISTSGHSENICRALQKAREMNIYTISLLGNNGGKAAGLSDLNIVVPSDSTVRIQEIQLHVIHILCRLIEDKLFRQPAANAYQGSVLENIVQA